MKLCVWKVSAAYYDQFNHRARASGGIVCVWVRAGAESDVRRSVSHRRVMGWMVGVLFVGAVTSVSQNTSSFFYMQTPLFGAPQMKPQISCNLKLFTHKKWTHCCSVVRCGLGLRVWRSTAAYNEATHTLRVFCARCGERENKGLGLNYSPAAAAGRAFYSLGAAAAAFQLL